MTKKSRFRMTVMAICMTMVMSLAPETVFAETIDTDASQEARITKEQAIALTRMNEGKAILMNEYGEGYEVDVTYRDKLIQGLKSGGDEQICARTIYMDTANISPLSTTDSNYREKWDSTGSVKANSTIYFKTKNTPTEYLLTKVSVGYTISEPRVRVVDQALVAGCTGTYPSVTTQRKEFSPEGTSATFSTGFTKYVVNSNSALIGATYTITMRAGTSTSTWDLIFSNKL